MPTINYGSSGANQIGNVAVHPGTYGLRQSTLRALVADVGAQLAQNGFKWIFVLNGHGAPTHHMAVNDACDFVSDVFGATPSNIACKLLVPGRVEGVSGASLPMLVRALTYRNESLKVVVGKAISGDVEGVLQLPTEDIRNAATGG